MARLKLLIVVAFVAMFIAGWVMGTATEREHSSKPSTTQPHQKPPHPGSEGWLGNQLGLTADQDAKIKDIWAPLASARSKYMDQWQQINRDRDEQVRNLLTADQKAAMDSLYSEAEAEQIALEGRREKEYKDAVAKTNELLSPEQQKKYANILAHQHGGDRGHFPRNGGPGPSSGPGGPGGPGGPPHDHPHDHEPH